MGSIWNGASSICGNSYKYVHWCAWIEMLKEVVVIDSPLDFELFRTLRSVWILFLVG